MSFERLSNEVLQGIFLQASASSLANISSCSKHLHALVEPILYSKVSLLYKSSYPSYIRTIAAKPHLASYAKHFQASIHRGDWNYVISFLKPHEREWVRSVVSPHIPDMLTWQEFLQFLEGEALKEAEEGGFDLFRSIDLKHQRIWDATTAFLLILFSPHLISMDISLCGQTEQSPLYECLSRMISLENLRVLNLQNDDDTNPQGHYGGTRYLNYMIEAGKFPNIKTLSMKNVHGLDFFIEDFGNVTNITELQLRQSSMPMKLLRYFISDFKTLKRFHYEHSCPELCQKLVPRLHASVLRKALENSKETIEELTLTHIRGELWRNEGEGEDGIYYPDDSEWDGEYVPYADTPTSEIDDEDDPWRFRPFGTFADFTKLRILKIDAGILCGKEVPSPEEATSTCYTPEGCSEFAGLFPASLEHLTIMKSTDMIFPCFMELFSHGNNSFPTSLKVVKLLFAKSFRPNGASWNSCLKGGLGRGVEIYWENVDFYKGN